MNLAHLLSKLQNCNRRYLDLQDSTQLRGVLDVLYREGRIYYYHKFQPHLRVYLKPQRKNFPVAVCRRRGVALQHLCPTTLITTSQLAICTAVEARRAGIGGVVLGKL